MNPNDIAGWLAAVLTFSTFACRDMAQLRALAVLANVAFIVYGASAALWPVLALHAALLPVNLGRLIQLQQAQRGNRAQPRTERGSAALAGAASCASRGRDAANASTAASA